MIRPLLSALLALALGVGPNGVLADSAGPEMQAKTRELARLQDRIQRIRAGLGEVEGQRNQHQRELRRTERRIGTVAGRLRDLSLQLKKHQGQLERLEARRVRERRELNEQRRLLAAQIRAAYALGRQERVKLLLNQEDPALVSRVMVYYDYFNRERARRVGLLNESLARLKETEVAIRDQSLRLAELREREENDRHQLELARAEREQAITSLNAEIGTKGQQLQGLRKDERRLAEFIEQLRELLADIPAQASDVAFESRKGKLAWPSGGKLAKRFGTARQAGGPNWDGVLIATTEGQDVRAVHHGRVAFADWLRGFGLLLILDHGDGYMSLYGHNQTLFKETGDWVEAGENVALVGRSGGRLNAGVYFGIRYRGQAVDPVHWCRPFKGREVG